VIIAICKLILAVLWFLLLFPLLLLVHLAKWDKGRQGIARLYFRGMMVILGIRLTVEGAAAEERPLLLVTNHISYLDIVVLGSITSVCFVPKSEIADWPVIGLIARICGAVFVDRRPSQAEGAKQQLHDRLAKDKKIVCLFPEGTTTTGKRTLPFKSSLFSVAEDIFDGRPLPVQAASIIYTHINNLPLDETQRPRIAWIGDFTLLPHLWDFLKLGVIRVKVTFHPPVTIAQFASRKDLASFCRDQIAIDLEHARDHDMVAVNPKDRKAG
jgi:1-acyl-sn-glycerol-3-phosphate acyltransferase